MVAGYYSYFIRGFLVVVNGNQDSKKYTKPLNGSFIGLGCYKTRRIVGLTDNCQNHVSKHLKNWFASKDISLLD